MNAPLPWQTEQWQRAVRLRVEQKLPHALLLQGPSGVGKQCFAKALSKVLLCLSPGPQGRVRSVSCLPSCRRWQSS